MSRIGKKPIPIPTGVTVTIEPEVVRVAGPKGDLAERKARVIEVRPGEPGERIVVRLKYTENRTSVISGLKRVSRPGRRTYVDATHVPKVMGGMGTTIMSTSQGVMTGHDARKAGVGGEVVAEVW